MHVPKVDQAPLLHVASAFPCNPYPALHSKVTLVPSMYSIVSLYCVYVSDPPLTSSKAVHTEKQQKVDQKLSFALLNSQAM